MTYRLSSTSIFESDSILTIRCGQESHINAIEQAAVSQPCLLMTSVVSVASFRDQRDSTM